MTTKTYRPDNATISSIISTIKNDYPHILNIGWRLFLREVKSANRQSILGWFWFLIPSVATISLWSFLSSQGIINSNTGSIPYIYFVASGSLLWETFTTILLTPINLFNGLKATITKVNFPKESLFIVTFLNATLYFLIKMIIIFIIYLFMPFQLSNAPGFFLAYALMSMFSLGLAFLILPFALLLRDVGNGLNLFIRFLFFLTPVAYSSPSSTIAQDIFHLNPLTHIIEFGRSFLFSTTYNLFAILLIASLSGVLFLLGLVFFRISMPIITERIGS